MNNQTPEPRVKNSGDTLDLHSIFFTMQGEGPFTGQRAIFVRLAGCNLQCPRCDTEYTKGRYEIGTLELVESVLEIARIHHLPFSNTRANRPLVVITGGEPLRQSIGMFVTVLLSKGFAVQIESNGVFSPDPILHTLLYKLRFQPERFQLVVSPKTKRINKRTAKLAHAFKYVLDANSVDPEDGLPILALDHRADGGVSRPPSDNSVIIYLNPLDTGHINQNKRNLQAAVASCMRHGYTLGIQLHKLIGLE